MIRKRAEEHLAGVELFRDLDARALKTLDGRLQTRVVPAGTRLIDTSASGTCFGELALVDHGSALRHLGRDVRG